MKKIIFLIIVSLFYNNSILAQIKLGFRISENISTVKYDNQNIENSISKIRKPRYKLAAYGVSTIELNEIMQIKGELGYSRKGFRFKQTYSEGTNIMDYLQLNLSGEIAWHITFRSSIYFYSGPYIAYWLVGKYYKHDLKTGKESTEKINFKENIDYEYNRMDAGIIGGIFYRKELKNNYLFIDAKYEYGLISTDKLKVDGMTNRSFSIGIGILFELD